MAGVKGMKGGGGARPGSGPKKGSIRVKRTVSEKQKRAIEKALRVVAKEKGMTIEEHMVRMCYDPEVQDTVKASIWKSVLESLVSKETKSEVNLTQNQGPAIGLPPVREDPALTVVKGGKDEES